MNESFWDAYGVEIGACTIFNIFPDPANFPGTHKQIPESEKIWDWMHWVAALGDGG